MSIEALELEQSHDEEAPFLREVPDLLDYIEEEHIAEATNRELNDPLRAYLNEIGETPLLTAEEEVSLAKQIEAGVEASKRLAEEKDLPGMIAESLRWEAALGAEAKQQFINSNLRLVVSIAKRYRAHKLQLLDLIQSGNLGLIRAVEKFDYRRGLKFSTVATWWIRQELTQAIGNTARTIRIPVNAVVEIGQILTAQTELAEYLDREPSAEDIAEYLEKPVNRVRDLLLADQQEPSSLDAQIEIESGQGTNSYELIEDRTIQPEELTFEGIRREAVYGKLETVLDETELKVLSLSFGLIDGISRTPRAAAEDFDMGDSRATARIKKRALAKLRNSLSREELVSILS